MSDIEAEVRESLRTDPHYPLGEPDAMKWAVCWRLMRDKHGINYQGNDTDGWMVGWFANAMATQEMISTGGSFLNADGAQDILDGKMQARPDLCR